MMTENFPEYAIARDLGFDLHTYSPDHSVVEYVDKDGILFIVRAKADGKLSGELTTKLIGVFKITSGEFPLPDRNFAIFRRSLTRIRRIVEENLR